MEDDSGDKPGIYGRIKYEVVLDLVVLNIPIASCHHLSNRNVTLTLYSAAHLVA